MTRRKQKKSQQSYSTQKIKRGRTLKPFENKRTPEQRSRALALRETRMRLLNPLVYEQKVLGKMDRQSSIFHPKNIKHVRHGLTNNAVVRKLTEQRTPCQQKAQRRAVLLARGTVQKSGGAPGPYRKHGEYKCK